MGTPYFPGLFLDENDPSSRFLELFNTFGNQYPDIGRFLQPDDPQLLEYQKLASSPTGSEELISSYLEQLPTREQYKPSFGRKMAAFALGTLSGNPATASEVARRHVERPYEQAIEDWKLEGSNISSRARLMDAERNRQLQAFKYGLQTKAGAKKSEYTEEARKLAEARRLASEVESEERSNQARLDREEQENWRRNLSEAVFEQKKAMDELYKQNMIEDNTRANEAAKRAAEAKAAKAADLDQINKRLSAFASQQGIDASDMTALDVAKNLAFQRAKSYKFFADLLEEKAGPDGNIVLSINETLDPERAAILKKWMNSMQQKYLRGEF